MGNSYFSYAITISSEAQKLWMDVGEKFTIKQCHTINIKFDEIGKSLKLKNHATFKITKNLKSRNRSSTAINKQMWMKIYRILEVFNTWWIEIEKNHEDRKI